MGEEEREKNIVNVGEEGILCRELMRSDLEDNSGYSD